MILAILRGVFILLVAAVAALYVLPFQEDQAVDFTTTATMLLVAVGIALVVVGIDLGTPQKKLSALSGVILGLIAGLVVAFALTKVLDLFFLILYPEEMERRSGGIYNLFQGAKVLIGLITCYLGISLVLQTKDDFRFVIPYVEFTRQIRGPRPVVLDTSVIIDGRVLDLVRCGFLTGSLIVPRFVLQELHALADSADKLKRARGRRGLDILSKLQQEPGAVVSIHEGDSEGATVDEKLLSLTSHLQAKLMTNDFNLAKVAALRKVEVLNLNDLAAALRPVVLPGESLRVRVIRPGEGPTQGVGFLEDGTMVVVENGRGAIGQEVEIQVTSTIQTSAGRMIFGRIGGLEPATAGGGGAGAAVAEEATRPTGTEGAPARSASAVGGRNPRRNA